MGFLDEREAEGAGGAEGEDGKRRAADFLIGQCRHANPYVAHLALEALSRNPDERVVGVALELGGHDEPLVREGAGHILAAAGHEKAQEVLKTAEVGMHSTVEKILLLRSVPLFERLSGEDLASLARLAKGEIHEAGEVVFKEGEPGDALYVIVRGAVEIRRGADDVITVLKAPDVLGEMAVLDERPRSATATAVEGTELLGIGSEEFHEALRDRFEVADGVIRLLTQRLRVADQRIADLG